MTFSASLVQGYTLYSQDLRQLLPGVSGPFVLIGSHDDVVGVD